MDSAWIRRGYQERENNKQIDITDRLSNLAYMIRNIIPKRHKFIILVFALCLSLGWLTADELDDKMQQLRQIEQQIDTIQKKAKQAEQKKQKTQSELQVSQKLKAEAEQKASLLKKKETVVYDSLQAVIQRVQTNEEKIADLKKNANFEFLRLFYIDQQDQFVAKATPDKFLLSLMISITQQKIRDLTNYHQQLVKTEEQRRKEYLTVKSSRIQQFKKSQQYQKKIVSLNKQTKKLEQEKMSYDQQIAQLKKDAAELETLIARLSALSGKQSKSYQFSGPRIPWPVKGKIIRDFGEESRGNNTSVISNGIDIAVPEGTSVKCIEDGEVVFSERYGGQGKLIIVDHKNGFFSVYAYNSELLVSKGASVKKGQVIAKSGKTGSAQQPSLHFELRKDGRAVNPLNYLE
ncbi:MAG TPA: peptidoglycan DD-metalloendopeptidase family protein [Candidatus Cloacimonadota bacterium]|nr:peptidoglycan DD-metalloendopeptidase family protein [Candidatus Cloacimonadota bacterium]HQL14480.1 peptidoglycan DD-metalloendopeptidase family protein [Candidatus Cloacimonadota bacterium]